MKETGVNLRLSSAAVTLMPEKQTPAVALSRTLNGQTVFTLYHGNPSKEVYAENTGPTRVLD